MTNKVATLSADLVANTFGFDQNLSRSSRKLTNTGRQMSRSVQSFEKTVQSSFSNAARSVAAFQGPLGPLAGRLSSIASTVGTAGIALGGLALALGGVGFSLKRAADEGEKFERSLLRVDALLKTTNSASGQTAEGIRQFSRELALATLQSVDGAEQAAGVLLSFRSISGDTFKEALRQATNLSEVYGTDLKSNIVQLGKALEDPITGLTSLTRTGTTFSQSQKEVIRNLVETNRLADAQALILEEINRQVGGSGAAASQGLSGAYDTLAQRVSEFWQSLDDRTGAGESFAEITKEIAESLDTINQALAPELFKPLGAQIVDATKKLERLKDAREAASKNPFSSVFGGDERIEQQIEDQERLIEALQDKGIAQVEEQKQAERLAELNRSIAIEEDQWAQKDEERDADRKEREKAEAKSLAQRQNVITSLQNEVTALTAQTTALQDSKVTLEGAEQAYRIRNAQIQAGVTAMSQEGQQIADLIKKQDELNETILERKRIEDQITADWDAAQEGAAQAADERAKEAEERSRELARAGKEVGDTFVDSFKSFAQGADSASDAVKNLALNLGELIAQRAIFDPLASSIGSIFTGGFGGGGGGLFGGLFGGFFADGGMPPMGKVSVVGEEGPELFVPNTAGTIIPNDQIGGGGGTTIYADMRGASMEAVQRLEQFAQKINASIEPRAISAVANQRSRQPNLLGGA